MTIDSVIFMVSVVVAVFGAIMMIAQRNPVASVLYLILSLMAQAVLYVQLSALFVAAILILVYAGAILVLFLFVIMLLNLRGTEDMGERAPALSRLSKLLVGILLVVEIGFIIYGVSFPNAGPTGIAAASALDNFGSVPQVAELLFTTYLFPFELTSVLLLVAIIGAVVMAKRESGDDDYQLFHGTAEEGEEAERRAEQELRG